MRCISIEFYSSWKRIVAGWLIASVIGGLVSAFGSEFITRGRYLSYGSWSYMGTITLMVSIALSLIKTLFLYLVLLISNRILREITVSHIYMFALLLQALILAKGYEFPLGYHVMPQYILGIRSDPPFHDELFLLYSINVFLWIVTVSIFWPFVFRIKNEQDH